MKHEEVINEFVNGNEATTKNLFCERVGDKMVLYSYGRHFPLCIIMLDRSFFINKDEYSQTTHVQQTKLARRLGFDNFKELKEITRDDIIFLDTNKLKELIYNDGIKTKLDFIADKI